MDLEEKAGRLEEADQQFRAFAAPLSGLACRALEFDTSSFNYRSRRSDQAGLKARIQEICATRVRYGYRRVQVLLGARAGR